MTDYNFWLAVLLSVAGAWMYGTAHRILFDKSQRKRSRSGIWLARHADLSIIRAASVLLFVPGALRVFLTAAGYFYQNPDELLVSSTFEHMGLLLENLLSVCGILTLVIAFRNGASEAETRG